MKLRTLISIFLLTTFHVETGFASDPPASADEIAAANVVSSYLQATMAGDVASVQNYLSPQMLKRQQALLNNPGYSQQLSAAYANASYEIMDSRILKTGKIQIETKIHLNANDTVHSRFVLDKFDNRYLIISEQ